MKAHMSAQDTRLCQGKHHTMADCHLVHCPWAGELQGRNVPKVYSVLNQLCLTVPPLQRSTCIGRICACRHMQM